MPTSHFCDPQFAFINENDDPADSRDSALKDFFLAEPGRYWIETRGYDSTIEVYQLLVMVVPVE